MVARFLCSVQSADVAVQQLARQILATSTTELSQYCYYLKDKCRLQVIAIANYARYYSISLINIY